MSGPLPRPFRGFHTTSDPRDFPGLVSFWDFASRADSGVWAATAGSAPAALHEREGAMQTANDAAAPFGGNAIAIDEGQWLAIPRQDCPALDFHGQHSQFTLLAWIKRGQKSNGECEFIAGQWNETQRSRQYGLFLNIQTWQGSDQVCGHLSTGGGPTPGFKYCMDGPIGATAVDRDDWHCVAMSYDGTYGHAWLDGLLDEQPRINPYLLPGGLNDGGPGGSDFTVGAVDRGGTVGNFFTGLIAGIAVYDRVLSPAEMWALGAPVDGR